MLSSWFTWRLGAAIVGLAVGSCGGKVLVDEPPSGIGGGSGSGTSSTTSGSVTVNAVATSATGGTGVDCDSLLADFEATLAAAKACSPYVNLVQCDGSASVPDTCNCLAIVNETQPAAVQAAQSAHDTWVYAGCGPFECGRACYAAPTGYCMQVGGGDTGICQGVYPE